MELQIKQSAEGGRATSSDRWRRRRWRQQPSTYLTRVGLVGAAAAAAAADAVLRARRKRNRRATYVRWSVGIGNPRYRGELQGATATAFSG